MIPYLAASRQVDDERARCSCGLQVNESLLRMLRDADAAAPDGRGSLRALHLGSTRVGPAGIDALTQLRGLTALSFEGEDITSDGVQARRPLSHVLSGATHALLST